MHVGGGLKRYAALEVANTLFRVTFRLKNLRLAESIMKGVTHNLSPESATPFHTFPRSQQVTYKFFEGRIAIFNELYVSLHWRSQDLRCMLPAYHESKKHCHLQRAVCMSTLEKSRPALHASSLSMNLKSIKVIRMQILDQSGAIERQMQIIDQSGAIERQISHFN